jgi:hypothetical protein
LNDGLLTKEESTREPSEDIVGPFQGLFRLTKVSADKKIHKKKENKRPYFHCHQNEIKEHFL